MNPCATITPELSTTEAQLRQALAPLTTRFETEVAAMLQRRLAAGSFRTTAMLVDVRAFGWKVLEQYRDQALVLLDDASPGQRLEELEAVRLLSAACGHLMTLYLAAAASLRELATMIEATPLVLDLRDELGNCLQQCEGDLAAAVSQRWRTSAIGDAMRGPFTVLRLTGDRLARSLAKRRQAEGCSRKNALISRKVCKPRSAGELPDTSPLLHVGRRKLPNTKPDTKARTRKNSTRSVGAASRLDQAARRRA